MSRLIVFTDLDDTLFASERSAPRGPESTVAAHSSSGAPSSFSTPQQRRLLRLFQREADILIAVTGRSSRAFALQSVLADSPYAIVSHGGWLLRNGSPVASWADRRRSDRKEAYELLRAAEKVLSSVLSAFSGEIRSSLFFEGAERDVPVYLSIKSDTEIPEEVRALIRRTAEALGVEWHSGHRNAAIMAPGVSKQEAVAFLLDSVIERRPDDTVVGVGDSQSDLAFMGLSDFAIQPTKSQIWDMLHTSGLK